MFSVVDQVYGASFVTEPNKTIVVSTGSNQTFTWQLNLTNQEKLKQLQVQFGPWNKEFDIAADIYLMTFVQEPSENGSVLLTTNHSIVKRLQWMGDLTRDYFVAFKLFDVKLSDSGDYGIRFRVEFFPIVTLESWFTLSVKVKKINLPQFWCAGETMLCSQLTMIINHTVNRRQNNNRTYWGFIVCLFSVFFFQRWQILTSEAFMSCKVKRLITHSCSSMFISSMRIFISFILATSSSLSFLSV